jgi:hypothetical protein
MANPPKQEPSQTGFLKSLTGGQNQQRVLEQTIVAWQDDENVIDCPFCKYLSTSCISNKGKYSIFRIESIIADFVDV